MRAAIDRRVSEAHAARPTAEAVPRHPRPAARRRAPRAGPAAGLPGGDHLGRVPNSLDDDDGVPPPGLRHPGGRAGGRARDRRRFEGECPYRGLESFDEAHARFFFGREALTQEWSSTLRPGALGRGEPVPGDPRRLGQRQVVAGQGRAGPGLEARRARRQRRLARRRLHGPGTTRSKAWPSRWRGSTAASRRPVAIQGLIGRAPGPRTNTLHLTTRLALRDAPASRRLVRPDRPVRGGLHALRRRGGAARPCSPTCSTPPRSPAAGRSSC